MKVFLRKFIPRFLKTILFLNFIPFYLSYSQDIISTIDENVLNFYASTIGSTTHEEYISVDVELPDLCDLLLQMYHGDPTGRPDCTPSPVPLRMHLADGMLNWIISAPRFEISVNGINFKADIQANFLEQRYYRRIELPVFVSFTPDNAKLMFTIEEIGVPLEFPITGQIMTVDIIYPSGYYSTYILINNESFYFNLPDNTSRNVIVGIGSMEIEYLEGKIKLKHYIDFE